MKRLAGLDALRAIAAMSVALFHLQVTVLSGDSAASCPRWLKLLHPGLNGLGTWGVGVFFLLSGLCIHLPHASVAAPLDLRTYGRRRFLRIYPPHLVCLLVSFALAFAVDPAFTRWGLSCALTIPKPSWFVLHLLLLHTFSAGAYHSINYALWSIALEAHFYILYPLLVRARRRVSMPLIIAVLFGIACAAPVMDKLVGLPTFFSHNFVGRFWEWVLGAYLAERWIAGKGALLPGWAVAIVTCISLGLAAGGERLPHGVILQDLTLPWLLVPIVDYGARWSRGIIPFLQWLGARSYSLYLYHPVVIAVVMLILFPLGVPPTLLCIAALAGFLVVSAVAYRVVELPCIAWAKGTTIRRAESELIPKPSLDVV